MFGKICVTLSFLLWLTVALAVGIAACILVYNVYERIDHRGADSTALIEQTVTALVLAIFSAFFAATGPIAGLFAAFFWRWSGRNKKSSPAGEERLAI